MLQKSKSQSSLFSQPKQFPQIPKIDSSQLCQRMQQTLEEASVQLSHREFAPIFEKIVKNMIVKAQIQSLNTQFNFLSTIKQSLSLYDGSLQLNIRALLLEILSQLNSVNLEEIPAKIKKAKHVVLHTRMQYLLSKIFLLEVKYYCLLKDEHNALKCLKKCLQLSQTHMIQFMQEQQQIRRQIVNYSIVAYYECFNIQKKDKPGQALEYLFKAINAAKKNLGKDSKITKGLLENYYQQENFMNSLEKQSVKSKAVTDILDFQRKKNYKFIAFYSWEDEKIIAQYIKIKGKEQKVISQAMYDIKLDMNKVKILKSSEWLSLQYGDQIVINEDQLLKILGYISNGSQQKQMTTGLQLKNLSRQQIMKKPIISSSSDEQQFFSRQELNILKFPRVQSSKKFKQTQ